MKIKLVDILSEPEDVELGTCELCFWFTTVDNPVAVLEVVESKYLKKGTELNEDMYWYDWGDYFELDAPDMWDLVDYLNTHEVPELKPKPNPKYENEYVQEDYEANTEWNWFRDILLDALEWAKKKDPKKYDEE